MTDVDRWCCKFNVQRQVCCVALHWFGKQNHSYFWSHFECHSICSIQTFQNEHLLINNNLITHTHALAHAELRLELHRDQYEASCKLIMTKNAFSMQSARSSLSIPLTHTHSVIHSFILVFCHKLMTLIRSKYIIVYVVCVCII